MRSEATRPKPLLIVLSGPSGVGKDAVLSRLKAQPHPMYYPVTITTRPMRRGERDGVDYIFVTPAQFRQMAERGELLEQARVYGHWYGVPRGQVRQALAEGRDVIIKVDVQGAATIKGLAPQAVLIFLSPPSLAELEARLRQRHTENSEELEKRLAIAREEMKRIPLFDYVVVNRQNQIDQAVAQIESIITAEKCRVNPRVVEL